jgi:hypothetical protein
MEFRSLLTSFLSVVGNQDSDATYRFVLMQPTTFDTVEKHELDQMPQIEDQEHQPERTQTDN